MYHIVNMLNGLTAEQHATFEAAQARLFGYWRKSIGGQHYAVIKPTARPL